MVVVTVVIVGRDRMTMGLGVAMPVIVMLDRVAAGIAGMRAENRDQAGEDGAQQRQKDDCLNHGWVNPSSD